MSNLKIEDKTHTNDNVNVPENKHLFDLDETKESDVNLTDTNENNDEDLEDGEIETDDDESTDGVKNNPVKSEPTDKLTASPTVAHLPNPKVGSDESIVEVDKSPATKKGRFRRMDYMEDDWAGNIEHAIAAALKRDGKEPPPKVENRITVNIDSYDNLDGVDERRIRKRKKRDEKERVKNKRLKHNETDLRANNPADDIDEDEMVCVRGGSPTLPANVHLRCSPLPFSGPYESDDSYQSSYGSYESTDNRKMSYDERRQSRRAKDRRNRGNHSTSASGKSSGIGNKRRIRHDSDGVCIMNMRGHCNDGDDCHRSHDARAPRKLELCKFYLMDCCAKKDKCSYMHADFPCKYYYLGMECVYKSECKFSHGDPLTEQLRNILLKHIETAPKEILGNFRRISRENALNLLLATHVRLCSEKGVENKLELPPAPITQSFTRKSRSPADNRDANSESHSFRMQSRSPTESRVGNPFASLVSPTRTENNEDEENWDAEECNNSSKQGASSTACNKNQPVKSEKQRKSRWRDHQNASLGKISIPGHSAVAPDILSLKNLKGVITPEQIDRLEAIGIDNLEQISQLTVAQLNHVGLTISQINEIQLNALNIQKLGLIATNSKTESSQHNINSDLPLSAVHTSTLGHDDSQSIQDVDMRCLVGAVQTSGTSHPILSTSQLTESLPASSNFNIQELDGNPIEEIQSLTQKESGTCASVDFSKYLRDSNVKSVDRTSFNEILKDDKDDDEENLNEDEPSLLIDESRGAPSEEEFEVQNKDEPSVNKNENIVFTSKGEDDDDWDDDSANKTNAEVKPNRFQLNDFNSEKNENDNWQMGNNDQFYKPQQVRSKENIASDVFNMRWKQRNKVDTWQEKNKSHAWQDKNQSDLWQDRSIIDSRQEKSKTIFADKPENDNCFEERNDSCLPPNKALRSLPLSSNIRRLDNVTATTPSRIEQTRESLEHYEPSFDNNPNPFNDRRDKMSIKDSPSRFNDPRLGSIHLTNHNRSNENFSFDSGQKTAVDNYNGDWDAEDNSECKELETNSKRISSEMDPQLDIIPNVIRESSPLKYQRTSIYDGNLLEVYEESASSPSAADEDGNGFSGDRDMRISSFLESGDVDLRLPFKPVMTNYTPATEIDGSIASHAPIMYKVYEILIPKPDYAEIRRTMTVTEKTLDPRLRRIFCLKETNDSSENEALRSPPPLGSSNPHTLLSKQELDKRGVNIPLSGPRMDPRRRKENPDIISPNSLLLKSAGVGSTNAFGLGQNVDIRLLLQKSVWYKNLNSKFKIMVNQQLALVSTELKKFHQDPNPDKVFDMKFLVTNQYLQQVLTNLGIFIDGNGQILQLESESDDLTMGGQNGGHSMMLPPAGMMLEAVSSLGMNIEYIRPQQSSTMGAMNPRFMGPTPIMSSFGPRFPADMCSNILRASPPVNPFHQFENSPGNHYSGVSYGGSSGSDEYANEHHPGNNQFDQADSTPGHFYGSSTGGNRNRMFRHNSQRNNSKDRWSGAINSNQQPSRNSTGRNRNFDNRSGNNDREQSNNNRRGDKFNSQPSNQSPPPPPPPQEEEENWD